LGGSAKEGKKGKEACLAEPKPKKGTEEHLYPRKKKNLARPVRTLSRVTDRERKKEKKRKNG